MPVYTSDSPAIYRKNSSSNQFEDRLIISSIGKNIPLVSAMKLPHPEELLLRQFTTSKKRGFELPFPAPFGQLMKGPKNWEKERKAKHLIITL